MQHYLNLLSLALPQLSRNHLFRQTRGPSDTCIGNDKNEIKSFDNKQNVKDMLPGINTHAVVSMSGGEK